MLIDRCPNTDLRGAKFSGCLVVLRWSVNSAGVDAFGLLVGGGSRGRPGELARGRGPAAVPGLPRGAHGRGMVGAATAIHVASRDTSDTRRLLIHWIPGK